MSATADSTWVTLIVPVLTATCGGLGAFILAQSQSARAARKEREASRTSTQLTYLDPLRSAAENLAWKLFSVDEKIREREGSSGGLDWMLRMFRCVKEPSGILGRPPSATEWSYWCNGEGFFAVSTVYATAAYLLHARRARRGCTGDLALMRRLDAVRLAMGHEHGIYVMLQDSIGEFVVDSNGLEVPYRRFCAMLFSEEERPWFLGILDYFRDVDRKTPEQRRAVLAALHDLLDHLSSTTGIAAVDPLVAGSTVLR